MWHNPLMIQTAHSLEKSADKLSFIFLTLFMVLSLIVLSTTMQLEAVRDGQNLNPLIPWVTEATSHFSVIIAALTIPLMLTQYPISLDNIVRRLPVLIAGFAAFTILHILMMVALRKGLFPVLIGRKHEFGLLEPSVWLYEVRKDFMSYIYILAGFIANRHIAQLSLEAKAARSEAQSSGRLTLKSGGRVIFLAADEIIWAKSASNYVEVHTESGEHLARMTLSNLEKLLKDAGDNHIRAHRSYLIKRSAIREIIPTGDGDAKVILTNGTALPSSRKYRPALEAA